MKGEFSVIIECDAEAYYVGFVPTLHSCHTQAKSVDELMDRVREAIELCIEVEGESPEDLHFVGVRRVVVGS